MLASRRVPVLDCVGHAVQFLKSALRPAAGVLAALAAAAAVNQTAQLMNLQALSVVSGIAYFLLVVMANGALFRLALGDQHPGDPEFRIGPLGLQWAKPEWRILGAVLLLALFGVLAVLTLILVLSIVGMAGALSSITATTDPSTLPPSVLLAVLIVPLILGCLLLWVAVRLCLYLPATMAERQIRVFSTWPLTKGQFWPVFGAYLLVSLPSILVGVVAGAATVMMRGPDLKGAMPPSAAIALGLLFGAVTAGVQMPLTAGLLAEIYKRLRHPAGVAALSTSV